jgi:hypothetical protein
MARTVRYREGDRLGRERKRDGYLSMETRWAAWRPSLRKFPMTAAAAAAAAGEEWPAVSEQALARLRFFQRKAVVQ